VAHRWFVEWAPEVLALRDAQLAVNLIEVGAAIAGAAGEAERSGRIAGFADARRTALTMGRTPEDEMQLARFYESARAVLGEAEFAAARQEGRSLTMSEAFDLVTSLRVVAAG
jgi:hypothetical protein